MKLCHSDMSTLFAKIKTIFRKRNTIYDKNDTFRGLSTATELCFAWTTQVRK